MTAVAGVQPREQARRGTGGRVLVGIDDSPGGLAALRWAIGFARSRSARRVALRARAPGLPRHGGLHHRGCGRGPVTVVTPRRPGDRGHVLESRSGQEAGPRLRPPGPPVRWF